MELKETIKGLNNEKLRGKFVVAFADGTIMTCENFAPIMRSATTYTESMREKYRITRNAHETYFSGGPALLMAVMVYNGEQIVKFVGRKAKPLKALETAFGKEAYENMKMACGV